MSDATSSIRNLIETHHYSKITEMTKLLPMLRPCPRLCGCHAD